MSRTFDYPPEDICVYYFRPWHIFRAYAYFLKGLHDRQNLVEGIHIFTDTVADKRWLHCMNHVYLPAVERAQASASVMLTEALVLLGTVPREGSRKLPRNDSPHTTLKYAFRDFLQDAFDVFRLLEERFGDLIIAYHADHSSPEDEVVSLKDELTDKKKETDNLIGLLSAIGAPLPQDHDDEWYREGVLHNWTSGYWFQECLDEVYRKGGEEDAPHKEKFGDRVARMQDYFSELETS